MSKKDALLRSLQDKTDDEKRQILSRRFNLNWGKPEKTSKASKPCKFWYAKVFTYCDPDDLEEELNFFLFIVNVFGYLWHICFNQESTIFLGCIGPCGQKQTVLYYSITDND